MGALATDVKLESGVGKCDPAKSGSGCEASASGCRVIGLGAAGGASDAAVTGIERCFSSSGAPARGLPCAGARLGKHSERGHRSSSPMPAAKR